MPLEYLVCPVKIKVFDTRNVALNNQNVKANKYNGLTRSNLYVEHTAYVFCYVSFALLATFDIDGNIQYIIRILDLHYRLLKFR